MATIDITSAQHATYGTHSHGEETLATRGGAVPGQLRWSDLHPPGVQVLPKGSPPAGAGEINWEDTLGGKFALALEQLEGLLYAVFGSRPAAYNMAGQWRKCQWYDRLHPRCLWGPEMWERRLYLAWQGCNETGTCWDYQESGKEYAALGENPPCCPMPKPSVPIRSRSGDPAYQYARGVHDRTYFPLGSVARDLQDSFPFDPEGYGWFGATQPGRNDAATNPWLSEANGYTWKAGQAVTFRWTKPAGVAAPDYVFLYYKLPGTSWVHRLMVPNGETYEATLGDASDPYPHGRLVRWFIRIYCQGSPVVDRFDPGGASPPAEEDAYTVCWYTHFNPYSHGLPEMLADYGGVDVRHGTDRYQFDGSETIQPELLNLVRWVLSWLGGDCCTGEYDTCGETDDRCDVFHHNPRFRSGDDGLCCVPMPIRFRWSGSNVHPHYLTGGKGLVGGPTPDPRPLHNHPNHVPGQGEVWGSEAARKSWRGINMLYADAPFDNPFYGGGYSWGTAPGTYVLMYEPAYDPLARVYAKYPSWGLRPGDVLEAAHLQEIIDAVDYLIDYGAWTTTEICTRKRTPENHRGYTCGHSYSAWQDKLAGAGGYEQWLGCNRCCANADQCTGFYALGWRTHSWYPDVWETILPDSCAAWPAPTWEECYDPENCQHERCRMVTTRRAQSYWNWGEYPENPDYPLWTQDREYSTNCDAGGDCCGSTAECRGCYTWNYETDDWDLYYLRFRRCYRKLCGASFYACTPPQCLGGWDENHGGLFKKNRRDHDWHHGEGLYMVATGPPGQEFSGNCLGDLFACGEVFPTGSEPGAWFHEVVGVKWDGLATAWFDSGCDGYLGLGDGSGCPWPAPTALPPGLPDFGLYDQDGDPLCAVYDKATGIGPYMCGGSDPNNPRSEGRVCECDPSDFPVCRGEAVWVAVDLNLDGSGKPYRNFPGRGGDLPPYEGRGVPRLRDYDLNKDPTTWMHDCPCETWTGAGVCEIT